MKFIHVSDPHLGYRQYGLREREEDFYKAMENVFDCAIERKESVVIAGDLFDAVKPSAYAVHRMCRMVERMKSNGLQVLGVEGNHDKTGNDDWLYVCGVLPLNDTPYEIDGVKFCGIDFCKAEEFLENLDQMKANERKFDVLVCHTGFAETGDSFTADLSAWTVAPKLSELGVKYVATGHIHIQNVSSFNGIVFGQPGSTELKSIDEEEEKCVFEVEIGENGKTIVTPIPIKTRGVLHYTISNEEMMDKFLHEKYASCENLHPLYVIHVDSSVNDGVNRVESFLTNRNELYRIVPFAGMEEEEKTAGYDRSKSIETLSDAIVEFFDEESDEYKLVKSILETPDNLRTIAETYINEGE